MSKEKTIEIPINHGSFDKVELSVRHEFLDMIPPKKENHHLFVFPLNDDQIGELDELFKDEIFVTSGIEMKFHLKPEIEKSGLRALALDAIAIGRIIDGINSVSCYIYVPDDLEPAALEYAREHYMEITDDVRH